MTNSINYHIMENTTPKLGIIESDPWLEPYSAAIEGRHQHAIDKELELTNGKSTLSDFATGYLYFGLHRTKRGWVFREWAPNAKEIYIIGDFNGWKENGDYRMYRVKNSPGVWEVELNPNAVKHGDLYKLKVRWNGGEGERIPAWATRVVQDEQTKIFSAQVWAPEKPYKFRKKVFRAKIDPLMIYECHIGMAQNEEKVGTYNEFREKILPRVAADGYNCIQIMAIQEHPYYGSFGYHVSSFFAPSSRFGTPEELKELIDTAHRMGIAVIIAMFTIIPIALATMMEHVGDIAAISATVGHNYINDPGLNRTLLGDGLATTMAGLLGGPANTTYGENTGVLALSKIYDPLVIRIAAVLAIILSFSPKFEAVINTIPTGIIGGISFVLYGMISAIGVRNVVENRVDFTNSRNLIVAAVILVCALGFNSVGGVSFAVAGVTINLSGLAVAAIAGILLNAILPGNDYEFDAADGSEAATSSNLQV